MRSLPADDSVPISPPTTPPRVSAIMPVKDTPPELLRDAVRSVVGQDSAEPLEIVVWNDGSASPATLGELGRLSRFGRPDRRIIVAGTPDNRGISAARNAACRLATGDWYVFLDSDDRLPPAGVRLLLERAADGPRLVLGQCRVEWPDGRSAVHRSDVFLQRWATERGTLDDPLLSTVFPVHGGLVHRKVFWRVDGFDVAMHYAELTDWFLRVALHLLPDEVGIVSDVTYLCRKRIDSHSRDRVELERHRVAALRRYGNVVERGVTPTHHRRCENTRARVYDLVTDSGRFHRTPRSTHPR